MLVPLLRASTGDLERKHLEKREHKAGCLPLLLPHGASQRFSSGQSKKILLCPFILSPVTV